MRDSVYYARLRTKDMYGEHAIHDAKEELAFIDGFNCALRLHEIEDEEVQK